MSIPFKPLSNYIVLDVVKRKAKMLGSLLMPETAEMTHLDSTVIAVSEDKDDSGKSYVRNVQVGDKVIFDTMGGFSIILEGKEYIVIRENQVIGITYEEIDEEEQPEIGKKANILSLNKKVN